MNWFRSHHGAPTDPLWLEIAAEAQASPAEVFGLWWAVLDYASQADDRGSVAGFKATGVGLFFRIEPQISAAIMGALLARGMIVENRVANWDKRQPKRERDDDTSTERVRAYRERVETTRKTMKRHETPRNARKRPRLDKIRVEEKEKILQPESSQTPSRARPEKSLADRYAFEGRVIRLKQPDFDRWQTTFGSIPDLAAELEAMDAKFAGKIAAGEVGLSKNWFATASAWLRTSHERRLAQAPPLPDLRPDVAENDRPLSDRGGDSLNPTLGQWRRRCAYVKAGHEWNWQSWGIEPGPGCGCPPDILAEYGLTPDPELFKPYRLRSVK